MAVAWKPAAWSKQHPHTQREWYKVCCMSSSRCGEQNQRNLSKCPEWIMHINKALKWRNDEGVGLRMHRRTAEKVRQTQGLVVRGSFQCALNPNNYAQNVAAKWQPKNESFWSGSTYLKVYFLGGDTIREDNFLFLTVGQRYSSLIL